MQKKPHFMSRGFSDIKSARELCKTNPQMHSSFRFDRMMPGSEEEDEIHVDFRKVIINFFSSPGASSELVDKILGLPQGVSSKSVGNQEQFLSFLSNLAQTHPREEGAFDCLFAIYIISSLENAKLDPLYDVQFLQFLENLLNHQIKPVQYLACYTISNILTANPSILSSFDLDSMIQFIGKLVDFPGLSLDELESHNRLLEAAKAEGDILNILIRSNPPLSSLQSLFDIACGLLCIDKLDAITLSLDAMSAILKLIPSVTVSLKTVTQLAELSCEGREVLDRLFPVVLRLPEEVTEKVIDSGLADGVMEILRRNSIDSAPTLWFLSELHWFPKPEDETYELTLKTIISGPLEARQEAVKYLSHFFPSFPHEDRLSIANSGLIQCLDDFLSDTSRGDIIEAALILVLSFKESCESKGCQFNSAEGIQSLLLHLNEVIGECNDAVDAMAKKIMQ